MGKSHNARNIRYSQEDMNYNLNTPTSEGVVNIIIWGILIVAFVYVMGLL